MSPKWMCGKCAHCSKTTKTTTPNKDLERWEKNAWSLSCGSGRSGNPSNEQYWYEQNPRVRVDHTPEII
jgi:hypothetical protein